MVMDHDPMVMDPDPMVMDHDPMDGARSQGHGSWSHGLEQDYKVMDHNPMVME